MKAQIIAIFLVTAISFHANAQLKSLKSEDIYIQYEECAAEYAKASLEILELVKRNAMDMGFAFPGRIHLHMIKSEKNRLYFNKRNPNSITWEFKSLNDFLSPGESGYNNIYGLCHEIGHACMFNITPHKNNWMTRDYREGWADFFGNIMIDSLHKILGPDFWPDPHNYLEYAGMQYFVNRLESDTVIQNASFNYSSSFWYNLSLRIGVENISSFFRSVKSSRIRNPHCETKFLAVLKQFITDEDFIADVNKNLNYLLLVDPE